MIMMRYFARFTTPVLTAGSASRTASMGLRSCRKVCRSCEARSRSIGRRAERLLLDKTRKSEFSMDHVRILDAPLQADQRLLSLDALRGFDLFWIIGGKEIVQAAAAQTKWPWLQWMCDQLEHTEWHGF